MHKTLTLLARQLSVPFILVVLAVALISSLFFFEQKIQREAQESVNDALSELLVSKKQYLSEYIKSHSDFLYFLLETPPIQGVSSAQLNSKIEPIDDSSLALWKTRLSTTFQSMMHTYTDIRQLRLIDGVSGDELVRVDRFGGVVKVQPAAKLQNKASKEYFLETLKLTERGLYVSQIDLNKERGAIVYPIEPTLRFALPVYNDNNVLFSVLVLNINAEVLLTNLYSDIDPALHLLLLNQSGHFIYHSNATMRFSKDLNPDMTWQALYSQAPWFVRGLSLMTLTKDVQQQFIVKEDFLRTSSSAQYGLIKIATAIPVAQYTEILFEKRVSTYGLLFVFSIIFITVLVIIWFYFKNSQKLIATQSEFADIIDGAAGGIIGFNTKLQITSFNRAAQNFFPELKRNIGLGYHALEHYMSDNYFTDTLELVSQNQTVKPLEISLQQGDERAIALELTVSPIRGTDTGSQGFALFVTDITAQNTAKEKIKHNNAHLEQQVAERTAELESAKKRAEEASNIKSSFISSISHEMRTPLNGILGTLNLVSRETVTKQQQNYLEMMKTSAQTLTSLINDILDLSKIEAGKLELDCELFDPITLLEHVTSSIGVKAHEKHLDYQLDALEVDYLGLFGDSSRLKQVLYNLLSNAIKFTDKGGVYVVAKTVTDNDRIWLEVSVRDTGVGISKNNYDKLFQAFSQESASVTSQYGGTGLGLSICKQLCKLMGGDISFSSVKSRGSEFTLRLPYPVSSAKPLHVMPVLSGSKLYIESPSSEFFQFLEKLIVRFSGELTTKEEAKYWLIDSQSSHLNLHLQHDEAKLRCCVFYDALHCQLPENILCSIAKPIRYLDVLALINQEQTHIMFDFIEYSPPFGQASELYKSLAGSIVMVVDDNQINLEVAKGMLSAQGVDVLTAKSGIDLLEKLNIAAEQSLDIMAILMDCNMPLMDGYEATESVRSGKGTDQYAEIPIIAMTAGTMSGERERCFAIGMNDYITKPVNPDRLFEILVNYSQGAELDSSKSDYVSISDVLEEKSSFNVDDALDRMQGDRALYAMICELFVADAPSKFNDLSASIEACAHDRVKQVAHAIRGQAGDIGADNLYLLATELEECAAAQQGSARYTPLYKKMEKELIFVNQGIKSMQHVQAS
ncbi:hypothetical protein PCIT_b0815 [Pseudoalteromonas citrea]|uniref:histidine kinase n=2 Tax=Pseudoalteromonas citrea TaxID=43655 RepID=A0AAD4AF18_9GAMM|nr:ATP-binding protein [Pseudoalteromonas citrea]KAF7764755.1 hypothetical protein PCIT_b0815 [Pseudoalteromonas citrea]